MSNRPPSILTILSGFKLNEIFKLSGIFFGTNLIIGIFVLLFKFLDTIFEFIGLNKLESDFMDGFKEAVNELSPHFWGGKVFLWAAIIYILLMIFAKFDEHWFKNFKFVFRVAVLSIPKLIGFSCLILFIGFFLGALPVWIALWIIFFLMFFTILLTDNSTFKKVYYREFPEEYKIDFGEKPPE